MNGGTECKKNVFGYVELFLLMLGTMVGVGFVTGAEIYSFFAKFGVSFVFGIILFFVLSFSLTYKILTNNANNENMLKMQNLHKNISKNTILSKDNIKSFLVLFNLLMIASAMFSGLKFVIYELFKNNQILIFVLCILFVFVILIFGVKCLAKVNFAIVAFLIYVILNIVISFCVTGNGSGCCAEKVANENINFGFVNITLSLFFASVYVFMNIVEIEPVVNEFELEFNKKTAKIFSFVFACVMTLLLLLFCVFLNENKELATQSMPMLNFFESKGRASLFIFVVGLILCLLTTLISCLLGVKARFSEKFKLKNFSASFVSVFVAILVGSVPFSVFVNVIYPIIGILNFAIYVFL